MSKKPNAMLAKLEEKIRAEVREEVRAEFTEELRAQIRAEVHAEYELRTGIALQMSLDSAFFAADEVFHLEPSQSEAFHSSYTKNFRGINKLLSEDGKDDEELVYSTTIIDRRLKEIVGPELFVPWDARYEA